MTNSYYNSTGNPASATLGRATNIRAEFEAIEAGFDAVETAVAAKAAAANPTFTGAMSNAVGSASLPSYTFTGDTNTGMWWPFADQIAWSTGGTERMRLSANGLGVGTIASYKLHISGTSVGSFVFGTATNDDTTSGSHAGWLALHGLIQMELSANANAGLGRVGTFSNFAWAGYTNQVERFRVTTDGEFLVGITSATSGGAKLQTVDGITFPATPVPSSNANTLDDYAEGTFTPSTFGSSTAGTGTYAATPVGRYTKVGRLVFFDVYIRQTNHTGTGNIRVGNLPYTSSSEFAGPYSQVVCLAENLSITAGAVLSGQVQSSSTSISLLQTPSGGGSISQVPMDTAFEIYISGSYIAG